MFNELNADIVDAQFEEFSDDIDFKQEEFEQVASSSYPDEILTLTPFDSGSDLMQPNSYGVLAEYKDIDTGLIATKQQKQARNFVDKVEKFVLAFNDVQLTEDLQEYIRQVAELQFQSMADLMSLVDINKMMIENVVARVNASQAEDYTIIAAYNNLVNQHIKLSRELAVVYKSVPTVIKKMRAEILSEDANTDVGQELITEQYGETQFNNGKDVLRKLLEKHAEGQASA